MSGVHIGEVEDVDLISPRQVKIELSINRKYKIPAGSEAEIPTQFISLGESGMVIVPPNNAFSVARLSIAESRLAIAE